MKNWILFVGLLLPSAAWSDKPILVGYGWTTSVMNMDLLESFSLGFELGLSEHLDPKIKENYDLILHEGDPSGSLVNAPKVAKSLVDKGVLILSGFPNSHDALLVSDFTKAYPDLLTAFIGAGHEALAGKAENIFTTGESMKVGVRHMLDLVRNKFSERRGLVLVNPRAVFSVNQARVIKELLGEKEFSKVAADFVNLDSTLELADDTLKKLEAGDYAYILITPYAEESVQVMGQLNSLKRELPIVTNSTWVPIEVLRRLIAQRTLPIYISVVWVEGSEESQDFEKRLSRRYGRQPIALMSYGYDLGLILARSVNRAEKPLSRSSILKAFRQDLCFEGTSTGQICFPESGGHSKRKLKMMEFTPQKGFKRLELPE